MQLLAAHRPRPSPLPAIHAGGETPKPGSQKREHPLPGGPAAVRCAWRCLCGIVLCTARTARTASARCSAQLLVPLRAGGTRAAAKSSISQQQPSRSVCDQRPSQPDRRAQRRAQPVLATEQKNGLCAGRGQRTVVRVVPRPGWVGASAEPPPSPAESGRRAPRSASSGDQQRELLDSGCGGPGRPRAAEPGPGTAGTAGTAGRGGQRAEPGATEGQPWLVPRTVLRAPRTCCPSPTAALELF